MTKRLFDLLFSLIALLLFGWLILISFLIASFDTQSFGIFRQQRVGQQGRLFTMIKIKTIHPKTRHISAVGRFFRKYKIDELPQFINILKGDMSVVGYRPDIPGYYDKLQGEDRKILELKPGLFSEATLKYVNEEAILAQQTDPILYNDTVIFPDKVRMNLEYYKNRTFWGDLKIVARSLLRICRIA